MFIYTAPKDSLTKTFCVCVLAFLVDVQRDGVERKEYKKSKELCSGDFTLTMPDS